MDVSTVQVQVWTEYAEEWMENLHVFAELVRVDLFTNEYHSEHVTRLK